jgi:hypothetical protein
VVGNKGRVVVYATVGCFAHAVGKQISLEATQHEVVNDGMVPHGYVDACNVHSSYRHASLCPYPQVEKEASPLPGPCMRRVLVLPCTVRKYTA